MGNIIWNTFAILGLIVFAFIILVLVLYFTGILEITYTIHNTED